jgi:protein TonB
MDTNLVLNSSFNELVFEKRNKNYGAYQIRRRYRSNVILSAFIASSVFVSAFAAYLVSLPTAEAAVPKENTILVSVPVNMSNEPPKPKDPPKPQPPKTPTPPPAKGAAPNATPEITNKPVDPKPLNDTIGNPNGVAGGSGIKLDTTSQTCLNCKQDTAKPPVQKPIVDFVKDPPAFRGDIDQFFQRTIKYPQMAKEANIEGTVWLSWVVDINGKVTDVEVIKGCNPALDKEALRAARLMPDWNPGKDDNGETVNFRYRKPIRFILAK